MILTKQMAEKAKALIGPDETDDIPIGVCYSLDVVSDGVMDLVTQPVEFWAEAERPYEPFKWPLTPEGDEKRRIFIDSLIGKDL